MLQGLRGGRWAGLRASASREVEKEGPPWCSQVECSFLGRQRAPANIDSPDGQHLPRDLNPEVCV